MDIKTVDATERFMHMRDGTRYRLVHHLLLTFTMCGDILIVLVLLSLTDGNSSRKQIGENRQ